MGVAFATAAFAAHSGPATSPEWFPEWSVGGFGTLGVVRSDQDEADFVSSPYHQPNGAGHTHTWHAGVDTKAGVQVDAQFDAKLAAVVQVVTKRRYDNSWTPELEWANVRYEPLPGLTLRAGRTVAPLFMLSDTANVGYANPWIRGPQELYGAVPVTHMDGLDLVWNIGLGQARNTVQASVGGHRFDTAGDVEITATDAFLLSDTLEFGGFALRAGYLGTDVTSESDALDALFGGLRRLGATLPAAGFSAAGRRAAALARRYDADDDRLEVYSLGVRYDRGAWLGLAEWADVKGAGILPPSHAWYVTAGHRHGRLMPYLTFADLDVESLREAEIPVAGLPPALAGAARGLNAGLAAVLASTQRSQRSLTAGLRWDVLDSAALKFEYQHIELEDGSLGRFGNVQPGFPRSGDADIVSVALDFVF